MHTLPRNLRFSWAWLESFRCFVNYNINMQGLVRISAALADPNRVRLLAACFDGELCVCQLVALVGLSNAAVSKHLSLLRDAGLLESRKQGRWVYYRLPEEPGAAAGEAIGWVRRHVGEAMDRDRGLMKQILGLEPVELCRMQRAGCCVVGSEKKSKQERRSGSPSHQEQERRQAGRLSRQERQGARDERSEV